ncbi:MAG: hypothetical protein EPN82_07490 [Bacteroidetes bacterium]|nr:MAG: hypothetical protein EPN82_07490 [Bacteroidota bacterium]
MVVKKFSYWLVLFSAIFLIITNLLAFAEIIETVCHPDKIVITINNLRTHSEKDITGKLTLKIDNLLNTYQYKSDINSDVIHLNLALENESYSSITFDQIKFSTIGKTNKNYISDLKIKAEIVNTGILRGVPVSILNIQPFEIDNKSNDIKVIQSAEIIIHLKRTIPLSKPNISESEKGFFASIANNTQLNYFLEHRYSNKKNTDKILALDSWYSPTQTYLKITTSKDGIAYIIGSDSLVITSPFIGKETKFLHLVHKGVEQPIYILNDKNGIFDESDTIIFVGLRPIGDTTWFNVFTNDNVFFLFYDESKQGERIALFPSAGSSLEQIENVGIDNHIEYEKIYSHGYENNQIGTEVVDGEGCFWDFITPWPDDKLKNPYEKETFTFSTLLNTDLNSSDSIKFTLYIRSKSFLKDGSVPFHKIKSIINFDTMDTYLVPHAKADTIEIKYARSKLNLGMNKIMLRAFFTKDQLNRLQKPDDIWLDYIIVEGTIKPYAFKGILDFELNNLNKDTEVKSKGFSSDKIFVLDTVKKIIQFPESGRGSFVRATSVNGRNPTTSFIMNDSILCDSTGKGLHIGVLRYPDYSPEYKLYTVYDKEVDNYLQNIPDSSIICLANNSDEPLPYSTRKNIQDLGSKEINTRVNGQSWIFLVRKGNLNSITEKRITNGTAQLEKYIEHPDGKSYTANIILPKGSSYKLLCRDESSIEHARIYNVTQSYLRDSNNQSDLIIITHNKFKETADTLARYRERTHHIKATVVDVDDIYKEFNYGIKSPHAIKKFLESAYYNWQKPAPSYLTLIGDACWDYRGLSEGAINKDYVPSYGWPVSDHWYTKLDGNDYLSDIVIGRIPIMDNEAGLKYIQKLKEYDSIPLRPWMKNFLFLSGGVDEWENFEFWDLITLCIENIQYPDLCGDTTTVRKRNKITGGEVEGPEIISKINSGAVWVSFFGHSAPTVFDMDGWHAYKLNNKPKYNFLTTWGCNTGAYSEPNLTCRNEEYLLEPERASIGVVGPSNAGIVTSDKKMMAILINGLAKTSLNLRQIGDIVNYGISEIGYNGEDTTTVNQLTILGDPLVKLKIKTQPDLYLVPEEIRITNKNDETVITESDSTIVISGFIYNGGIGQADSIEFRLIREFENYSDTVFITLPGICMKAPFHIEIPIAGMPGKHIITLEIDPYKMLKDADLNNNNATLAFEVYTQGLVPLEPLPFWDSRATGPDFRVIDPACNKDIVYNFEIRKKRSLSDSIVYSSQKNEITDYGTHIEWKPITRLVPPNTPYWLAAYKKSISGSTESNILWLPFTTNPSFDNGVVKYTINGKDQLQLLQLDSLRVISEKDSSHIGFDINKIPYKLISVHGIQGILDRDVEIQLNGKIYINSDEAGQAPIGFNIVVASGVDGSYKMKRNFDTWGNGKPYEGVNFVKFLKDSVERGDYILIATCGASFRLFVDSMNHNPTSIGSLDSLRYYLRQYGSKLADSITSKTTYDPNSFVMVGRWGSPVGSIPELLDTTGKIAEMIDTIEIKYRSGHFITPIIGPAKQWINLKINANLNPVVTKNSIIVYGLPYEKNDYIKLIENDTSTYVDLSGISAADYPYLKIEDYLASNNDSLLSHINSFSIYFIPLAELSFVKDNCTNITDSVMRADSITETFTVRNISYRTVSELSPMELSLYSSGIPPIISTKDVDKLDIDKEEQKPFIIETESLESNTNVLASLSLDKNQKDIYTFNNSERRFLHINEDTTMPYIKVKIDSVVVFDSILVKDGEYVSIQPKIEISLYDNSYKPVPDDAIKVRINAIFKKFTHDNDTLVNFGKNRPLKEYLSFISDSLDIGENIITIIYSDGTGNKDTSRITVFVSLNGFVEDVKNVPNPLNNHTTFSFYFKAPHQGMTANILVYNVSGQKVRTLKKEIKIGENKIDMEAIDDYGTLLPIGMYFYRINIESDFYVDPYFGKFVIMR